MQNKVIRPFRAKRKWETNSFCAKNTRIYNKNCRSIDLISSEIDVFTYIGTDGWTDRQTAWLIRFR